MVIKILSIVPACDSNEQGARVKNAILRDLESQDVVLLDFSGVTNVTSSFVNSALLDLSPKFDFDTIKSRIQIRRVNRQIGNMIKDRFVSEARLLS